MQKLEVVAQDPSDEQANRSGQVVHLTGVENVEPRVGQGLSISWSLSIVHFRNGLVYQALWKCEGSDALFLVQ